MNIQRTIKVLHVLDKLSVGGSSIHGVSRAVSWWIPRFDPSEFEFGVYSLRGPDPAAEVFRDEGIRLTFLDKGKFDLTTLSALLGVIDREKPDVLHLHGYGATNFGRIAGALKGVPRIVHEHGVFAHQPAYQTVSDYLLSSLTTKAIAVSDSVREFMIKKRHIDPRIIETFFVGVPFETFLAPSAEQVAAARQEFDIDTEDRVVCTVGRLDPAKGQVFLLEAAVEVLRQMPNVRFLLVGDGPDLQMLKTRADELGVSRNVIFAGHRNDVSRLLGMADVVAMPSLWEGKPISLLEAMALSKPVVGTPPVLSPDIMSEGDVGILVASGNADALAEGLLALLNDPGLAKKLGARGKVRSAAYDVSETITRLAAIYRDLAMREDSGQA